MGGCDIGDTFVVHEKEVLSKTVQTSRLVVESLQEGKAGWFVVKESILHPLRKPCVFVKDTGESTVALFCCVYDGGYDG